MLKGSSKGRLWSYTPKAAIVSDPFHIPENDIGNCSGLCVTVYACDREAASLRALLTPSRVPWMLATFMPPARMNLPNRGLQIAQSRSIYILCVPE